MTTNNELKANQKYLLGELLTLKKLNAGAVINGLQEAIIRATFGMEEEDIAVIEKTVGIKAL